MNTEQIKDLILKSVLDLSAISKDCNCIKRGVFCSVNEAVLAARGAYIQYSKLTLNERQEIINAIKRELLSKAEIIAKMTFEETQMGNISDKKEKIILAINKTPGIEDLITEVKTGDDGMTLYELSSYGVICAVHPCTNPSATLINNTISMLASGNAVLHCPHPRAVNVSKYITEIISKAVSDICGIDNLVVTLDESLMSYTKEIMTHPDISMVVATGGTNVLHQAMTCGKKVIGAGAANPTVIVDETADIKKAARDIVNGASFDNNLMCTSEKSIVAVSSIADNLIDEMKKYGIYYISNEEEMIKITLAAITQDMTVNKILKGKDANEILKYAGIKCLDNIKLIVVNTIKQHPFVTLEMLMPIIPLVRVNDFENALETAFEIEQGYRHTAVIHSQSIERLNIAAKKMQTSVFVKNGPSYAGIGFKCEGETSFTIATATGEGATTARHFARRRRCTLTSGFSIR